MTTITHRQLAISAAARYETNEDLQLPLPDGGTVPWSPSVAFAVLGHMSQHWTGLARPITVESGRPGAGSAVLRMDGTELVPTTHRLAAGTRADNGLPYVRELCGHISCPRTAPAGPAGPGSRCPDHTTDPVPAGRSSTYWGELAAIAWAEANAPRGEAARIADNQRRGVIMGGLAAGLTKHALHTLTGVARTTIDRIVTPDPIMVDPDDPDGPA